MCLHNSTLIFSSNRFMAHAQDFLPQHPSLDSATILQTARKGYENSVEKYHFYLDTNLFATYLCDQRLADFKEIPTTCCVNGFTSRTRLNPTTKT